MSSPWIFPMPVLPTRLLLCVCALALSCYAAGSAQTSSSSPGAGTQGAGTVVQDSSSTSPRARNTQPEASGSAITLETSETLFDIAAGLNACGYDSNLAESHPVRAIVRADVEVAVANSSRAQTSRAALCEYIDAHRLSDRGRELAQYVSLALFTGPPPALEPTADQLDMPPDALAVVNVLPKLREFSSAAGLHAIWMKHRPEYEAIVAHVHDPVTQMILGTNFYLKTPVSSYDGRRLLILVEPLLAANTPNARIYSSQYVVVTSPTTNGAIRMDQIRHLYLHYEIEPLVYARAASMTRLLPLLKPVQEAPLDFVYKSDVVALVTECLIKAIEARTMEVGFAPPKKPAGTRARLDLARYNEEETSYERQAEVVRRKQVDLDMRQGWTLTEYFYGQLQVMERNPEGLSESMGQMVYGMDVGREQHHDEQIQFLPEGSNEFVRRAPRQPTGMMLAEKKMLEGDLDGAMLLAKKAEADPKQDQTEAKYVEARVLLMRGDPEAAEGEFKELATGSKNPHTAAWAHIYLGRMYDSADEPARQDAIAEYKAALAVAGLQMDAKAAAEKGLKTPFVLPKAAAGPK